MIKNHRITLGAALRKKAKLLLPKKTFKKKQIGSL